MEDFQYFQWTGQECAKHISASGESCFMQMFHEKARYMGADFLTSYMMVKIIKLSGKRQITIPQDMRKKLDLKKGDDLVITQKGSRIVIERVDEILKDRFDDLRKHSAHALQNLWDNKYDEVWNNV